MLRIYEFVITKKDKYIPKRAQYLEYSKLREIKKQKRSSETTKEGEYDVPETR